MAVPLGYEAPCVSAGRLPALYPQARRCAAASASEGGVTSLFHAGGPAYEPPPVPPPPAAVVAGCDEHARVEVTARTEHTKAVRGFTALFLTCRVARGHRRARPQRAHFIAPITASAFALPSCLEAATHESSV